MKFFLLLLTIIPFIISCNGQEKTDLSKLNLNERIEKIITFDDKLLVGIETVEYPFCLLLKVEKSEKYSFDGIDLKGQKIIFQINSEKLKTDSISRFGGGHIYLKSIKNENELKSTIRDFNAENKIYGVRIEMKSAGLKSEILKKIELKYGKGTKNRNTDNGSYWNVKKENKYIFFAPDYDRLIILNSTNLSKTCYWDAFNGLIDFGGCDNEKYTQELLKNSTKPQSIKNKPIIKVDKNWNINALIINKSTESDFVKSETNKNFERMLTTDADLNVLSLSYDNNYRDTYFYFETKGKNADNQANNFFVGYNIANLKKNDVSFENGLKPGMEYEEVIKLFNKNQILNYEDLKISNYIEIKNEPYKVTLNFDGDNKFSGFYMNIKNYR